MAAEILARHIVSVLSDALSEEDQINLGSELVAAAESGARCAAQALAKVSDTRRSRGPSSTITKAVGPWSLWIDRSRSRTRSRCSAAASLRRATSGVSAAIASAPGVVGELSRANRCGHPERSRAVNNTAVGFRVNVLTLCASTPSAPLDEEVLLNLTDGSDAGRDRPATLAGAMP